MRLEDWKYEVYQLEDFTTCQNNPPFIDEDGDVAGCEELWCSRCECHASDCPCQTAQSIDDLEPDDMEWIEELREQVKQRKAGH
jgi:hypothetical protein